MKLNRKQGLERRHRRVRRKVEGTPQRPRLCVHKSLKHIYAQLVDDLAGQTLAAVTTNSKANKSERKSFCNLDHAKKLGADIGRKASEKGIQAVVFDRGGYSYHGLIKAFADAAREAGLKF